MPEPTSQAAPQEPVTPESAQVPEFAPTPGSTPQAEPQTEQKPLTLEDIQRIAREEATKIAQSQVAKGENRIQKLIQERFDALDKTKTALNLSDEQVKQAKQNIVTEAYASPEDVPPTPQPTPSQTPELDPIQYMNAQIGIVFAQAGQTVTKSDPEFASIQQVIDASYYDPDGLTKILTAATLAATAKNARLQTTRQTAAARVVGGGIQSSGQPQPQANSSLEGWEQAYKK